MGLSMPAAVFNSAAHKGVLKLVVTTSGLYTAAALYHVRAAVFCYCALVWGTATPHTSCAAPHYARLAARTQPLWRRSPMRVMSSGQARGAQNHAVWRSMMATVSHFLYGLQFLFVPGLEGLQDLG